MTRSQCDGQGLVEYSLILLLMAVALAVTLAAFGPVVEAAYGLVVAAFP